LVLPLRHKGTKKSSSEMTKVEIDKYISWIEAGKSFAFLREDLIRNGTPPEDVKVILQTLDDINSSEKLKQIDKKQGIQWIVAGSIILIMSIAFFVKGFFVIGTLVALVPGIATIFFGITKYNRKIESQQTKRQGIQWIILGTLPIFISLILFVSGSLTNLFIGYAIFSAGLSLLFFGIKKYRANHFQKAKKFKSGFRQKVERANSPLP
jgi:hypothetical protein